MVHGATRCLSVLMSCLLVASLAGQQKLNLTIVEGEGAINNIRQRATREVIVQVEDENRRPVAGAVVAFTLPNQGASGSFLNGARTLTLTTDNQGRAVARFTPNRVEGKYEIRVNASHQRETAALSVSQANILGAAVATGAVSAKLLLILGLVGGAVAAGVAVAATQGNGNGNGGGGGSGGGGTRPPTTVTPGTPSVGGPQ